MTAVGEDTETEVLARELPPALAALVEPEPKRPRRHLKPRRVPTWVLLTGALVLCVGAFLGAAHFAKPWFNHHVIYPILGTPSPTAPAAVPTASPRATLPPGSAILNGTPILARAPTTHPTPQPLVAITPAGTPLPPSSPGPSTAPPTVPPSPTPSPSVVPTPTDSVTPTPTPTDTITPTPTDTVTPTPTDMVTPTPTDSITVTPTPTDSITVTP
jgi:hypothetical protein